MPLKLFAELNFQRREPAHVFSCIAGLGAGMLFLSLNLVRVQGTISCNRGLHFYRFTVLMTRDCPFAGSASR